MMFLQNPFKQLALFCLIGLFSTNATPLLGQCNSEFTPSNPVCNVVTLTPDETDENLNYSWIIDGVVVSNERVYEYTHFVETTGNHSFEVQLAVSGTTCIQDTALAKTISIDVPSLPDPSIFTPDPEGELEKPFVHCNAFLDAPIYTLFISNTSSTMPSNQFYTIDWGDGQMKHQSNNFDGLIEHTYQEIGLFNVITTVKDVNNCVAKKSFPFFSGSSPGGNLINQGNKTACVPEKIRWPISSESIENNPPGTIYKIWVNDGLQDTTYYSHPPQSQFYEYNFTLSSCDPIIEDLEKPGSFTVTMKAENACGETNSTFTIEANAPGKADFKVQPDSIQCEGEEFEFINNSEAAIYFKNNLGGCTDSMKTQWTVTKDGVEIMEGFDFTITNGSLTKNEGFSAIFNQYGEYNITLTYEPAKKISCPPVILTKSICVLPNPESNFTSNYRPENSCASLDIEFTNLSNTIGSCEAAEYTWEVELESSDCGNEGSYSFIEKNDIITNKNAIHPKIRFDSSGVYNIMLTVKNRCGTDTTSTQIVIGSKPSISMESIENFCEGAKILPKIDVNSSCNDGPPPTYAWRFSGGVPNSFNGEFPDSIVYSQPGTYMVTLTVTNSCGPQNISQSFTVFPAPKIPIIRNNAPVCPGSTLQFDLETDLDLDYDWVGPNDFTSKEQSPQIENTTTDNAGEYFLTITNKNTGCVNDTSIIINIFDNIPVKILPENPDICITDSIQLIATGANIYTWSPNTFLNTTSGPTVQVKPTEVTTIEYIVLGTVGTCQNRDTVVVTVHPLPEVMALTDSFACINQTIILKGRPNDGDRGNGWWTGTNITMDGDFTPSKAGKQTLTYHFQNEETPSCEDSSQVEICVVLAPQASFIIEENQNPNCFQLEEVRMMNISPNQGDCKNPTYTWTIEFLESTCSESEGNWNFKEGDEHSVNPVFEFLTAGYLYHHPKC